MIIWDWHIDEYERVNFFCPGQRHIGNDFPDMSQIIACPDVPQINRLDRQRTIIYPCVQDTSAITALGFKYAFTKDTTQKWDGESIILPPVFEPQKPQEKTQDAVTIIHYYSQRDYANYQITKNLNIPIYGLDDNPCHDVHRMLAKTKFLVHFKHLGYLCNVVLKSMMNGTIPIMDKKSFELGYSDYLQADVSCIVVNDHDDMKKILTMSDATREDYIKAMNESMAKVMATYPEVKQKAKEFIDAVG